MGKNGTPASPATARASRVLPVPGGPKSSTPLGMRAPMAWKRAGSWRNSLISWSSSTASSHPATSAKVTVGLVLAHLLGPRLAELHDALAAALEHVHDQQERAHEQHRGQQADTSRPVHMESDCWSVVTSTGGSALVQVVDELVGVLGREGHLVLGVVAELAHDDVVVVLDLGGGDLAVLDGLA